MMHSTVAEEQLGRAVGAVAGEVEAAGVEAAGLDAERVRDADVAAPPGAGAWTICLGSGGLRRCGQHHRRRRQL